MNFDGQEKGTHMSSSAKMTPTHGFLTVLGAFLRRQGSGAPSLRADVGTPASVAPAFSCRVPAARGHARRPLLTFGCLAALALALAGASSAAATTKFGSFGAEAGQMQFPTGLAVDATGNLYVADTRNHRVDKFDGAGDFQLAWGSGVSGISQEELGTCSADGGCDEGGEGGTYGFDPDGVAVDSAGDVYVLDNGHSRVEKFKPREELGGGVVMEFSLMVGGEVNMTKTAEFEEPGNPHHITKAEENLCVANETCKERYAEVGNGADGEFSYLGEEDGNTIAVGPGDDLYVGDQGRVQVFKPSGEWKENISLPGELSGGQPDALAVDSSGDMFVSESAVEGVRELEPDGTEKAARFDAGSFSVTALALDPAGDLYVSDANGGFHVLKYDASGKELDSFGAGTVEDKNHGLAFSPINGELYASKSDEFRNEKFERISKAAILVFTPPPPGPLVESESVTPEPDSVATLEAKVNPEGHETTYHVEYVDQAQYEAGGFAGASATTPATLAAGFASDAVSPRLSGLTAGETYHWRVVASNECEVGKTCTATGEAQRFEETPPATIEGPWATDVAAESATLAVQVAQPQHLATEYRLEYGTDTSYGQVLARGTLGETEGSVLVNRHLQGLLAATTYHYRVVASNAAGTVYGADHTFTTQIAAGGPTLADGRVWELVSPANKHGARIEDAEGAYDIQAAADGSGIAYVANEPLTEHVEGRPWSFQEVVSQRGPAGWSSEEVAVPATLLPETSATLLGHQSTLPPALFSVDLSSAIIFPGAMTPPLSSEASERTLYLRNNNICSSAPHACYTPLVDPSNARGAVFGNGNDRTMSFMGATPDLSHIVFEDPVAFTPEAHNYPLRCEVCQRFENLYEWHDGKLELVNVFGSGAGRVSSPEGEHAFIGGPEEHETVAHAVSTSGNRIVWSYKPQESETIFEVRDMVEERTVQIGGHRALFQTMSADGSRIFYLEYGDLRMLNFETGQETDITANHGPGELSARVLKSVVGVGEDGKEVYFVAQGVLASGASPGEPNLYIAREEGGRWKIALIAKLSPEDENDWFAPSSLSPVAAEPSRITSRVSPNGRFVVFMSNRSLTGYDNDDANSGQPDEEVYLYDSVSGRLSCVSCNPTGARPVGTFDNGQGPLVDKRNAWDNHWIAANVPGWNRVEALISTYQPRYLLDDGRVFFDSSDALVAQDTNGTEDVYEYEPPGVGDCGVSSPAYSERDGGCVSLISSGTSSAESAFYDASESGDDVFFVTGSRLTSADLDNSFDVYDAHVCSAASPCPTTTASPPSCATADACRAAAAPQPEIFGLPPSATFSGAGNVLASAVIPVASSRSLTRAQRLARALRECRKKGDSRRAACRRRARKRYAAKLSGKASVTVGGHR